MKAILVVDIPDDYEEYGSGDWYVISDDDLRIVYEEDGALINYKYIDDDIAQLKPMPQKESEKRREEIEDWTGLIYSQGWNACIDEILGEEE